MDSSILLAIEYFILILTYSFHKRYKNKITLHYFNFRVYLKHT